MPPGAGILTRGLGMRGTDRYIKNQKPGRDDSRSYNCPRTFWRDRDGNIHPLPLEVHGHEHLETPYMTGRDRALVTTKYLDSPLGSSDGLPADYVERLFEYERSQWRRQGFISPYNNDRPRAARDKLEFLLWLHWHPDRRVLQKKLDERYDEEYDRSYVPISNGAQLRGGPPRGNRHDDRRHDQEQYRQRRGAIIYKRPTYRVRGLFDHRDPRYRPPYPAYRINEFQRGTNRPPRGTHKVPRNRHPKRYPVPRKIQGSRGTVRPRHHAYAIPRNRASQRLFGQPSRDYSVSGRRIRYPQIYDGYESPGVERPHRLPPHFIYPNPAPYYSRPLGHSHRHGRHEDDTDAEDNEDEQFRKRGGFVDRRGRPYGIGRDRAYLIRRHRSYEDEDLDCDFSGDKHDEYGF